MASNRRLAVVTGASGIGYELAKCCAHNGFDLLVAADEPGIHKAEEDFSILGVAVQAVQTDLAIKARNQIDRMIRRSGEPDRFGRWKMRTITDNHGGVGKRTNRGTEREVQEQHRLAEDRLTERHGN